MYHLFPLLNFASTVYMYTTKQNIFLLNLLVEKLDGVPINIVEQANLSTCSKHCSCASRRLIVIFFFTIHLHKQIKLVKETLLVCLMHFNSFTKYGLNHYFPFKQGNKDIPASALH